MSEDFQMFSKSFKENQSLNNFFLLHFLFCTFHMFHFPKIHWKNIIET